MDQMNGKLTDHNYTTDASNVTRQAPKPKELQTQLNSSLTIFTCTKPPQDMQQKFQYQN